MRKYLGLRKFCISNQAQRRYDELETRGGLVRAPVFAVKPHFCSIENLIMSAQPGPFTLA